MSNIKLKGYKTYIGCALLALVGILTVAGVLDGGQQEGITKIIEAFCGVSIRHAIPK